MKPLAATLTKHSSPPSILSSNKKEQSKKLMASDIISQFKNPDQQKQNGKFYVQQQNFGNLAIQGTSQKMGYINEPGINNNCFQNMPHQINHNTMRSGKSAEKKKNAVKVLVSGPRAESRLSKNSYNADELQSAKLPSAHQDKKSKEMDDNQGEDVMTHEASQQEVHKKSSHTSRRDKLEFVEATPSANQNDNQLLSYLVSSTSGRNAINNLQSSGAVDKKELERFQEFINKSSFPQLNNEPDFVTDQTVDPIKIDQIKQLYHYYSIYVQQKNHTSALSNKEWSKLEQKKMMADRKVNSHIEKIAKVQNRASSQQMGASVRQSQKLERPKLSDEEIAQHISHKRYIQQLHEQQVYNQVLESMRQSTESSKLNHRQNLSRGRSSIESGQSSSIQQRAPDAKATNFIVLENMGEQKIQTTLLKASPLEHSVLRASLEDIKNNTEQSNYQEVLAHHAEYTAVNNDKAKVGDNYVQADTLGDSLAKTQVKPSIGPDDLAADYQDRVALPNTSQGRSRRHNESMSVTQTDKTTKVQESLAAQQQPVDPQYQIENQEQSRNNIPSPLGGFGHFSQNVLQPPKPQTAGHNTRQKLPMAGAHHKSQARPIESQQQKYRNHHNRKKPSESHLKSRQSKSCFGQLKSRNGQTNTALSGTTTQIGSMAGMIQGVGIKGAGGYREKLTAEEQRIAEMKSYKFIEDNDIREIKSKMYNREGGITKDGIPFFMKEQKKERKINTNKSAHLRVMKKEDERFGANCRPAHTNYIQKRIETNQRHFQKCLDRKMKYFEMDLEEQARLRNGFVSEKIRENRNSTTQTHNQEIPKGAALDAGALSQQDEVNQVFESNFALSDGGLRGFSPDMVRSQHSQERVKMAHRVYSIHNSHESKSEEALEECLQNKFTDGNHRSGHVTVIEMQRKISSSVLGEGESRNNQVFGENSSKYNTFYATKAMGPKAKSLSVSHQRSGNATQGKQSAVKLVEADCSYDYNQLRELSGLFQMSANQNKIFEDFLAQTSRSIKYEPIEQKMQRLSSQVLQKAAKRCQTGGLKTPAEITQYLMHRKAKLEKVEEHPQNASKIQAPPQVVRTTPQRSLQQLNCAISQSMGGSMQDIQTPDMAKNASHKQAILENSKPLWVVNKNPQSTVINYKTQEGQHLSKLSVGDPYKLHRDLLENKSIQVVQEAQTQVLSNRKEQDAKANFDLKVGVNPRYQHQNGQKKTGVSRTLSQNYDDLNLFQAKSNVASMQHSLLGRASPNIGPVADHLDSGFVVYANPKDEAVRKSLQMDKDTAQYYSKLSNTANFKIQDIIRGIQNTAVRHNPDIHDQDTKSPPGSKSGEDVDQKTHVQYLYFAQKQGETQSPAEDAQETYEAEKHAGRPLTFPLGNKLIAQSFENTDRAAGNGTKTRNIAKCLTTKDKNIDLEYAQNPKTTLQDTGAQGTLHGPLSSQSEASQYYPQPPGQPRARESQARGSFGLKTSQKPDFEAKDRSEVIHSNIQLVKIPSPMRDLSNDGTQVALSPTNTNQQVLIQENRPSEEGQKEKFATNRQAARSLTTQKGEFGQQPSTNKRIEESRPQLVTIPQINNETNENSTQLELSKKRSTVSPRSTKHIARISTGSPGLKLESKSSNSKIVYQNKVGSVKKVDKSAVDSSVERSRELLNPNSGKKMGGRANEAAHDQSAKLLQCDLSNFEKQNQNENKSALIKLHGINEENYNVNSQQAFKGSIDLKQCSTRRLHEQQRFRPDELSARERMMNLDNYGNHSGAYKYSMHHKRSSKLNFEGDQIQEFNLKSKIINIKASVNVMSSNERRQKSSEYFDLDAPGDQKPKDGAVDTQKRNKFFQEIQNVNQGFQIQQIKRKEIATTKDCGVGNTPVKLSAAGKLEKEQASIDADKDYQSSQFRKSINPRASNAKLVGSRFQNLYEGQPSSMASLKEEEPNANHTLNNSNFQQTYDANKPVTDTRPSKRRASQGSISTAIKMEDCNDLLSGKRDLEEQSIDQQQIFKMAHRNLKMQSRQPIHTNPPKYLQKRDFGQKFNFMRHHRRNKTQLVKPSASNRTSKQRDFELSFFSSQMSISKGQSGLKPLLGKDKSYEETQELSQRVDPQSQSLAAEQYSTSPPITPLQQFERFADLNEQNILINHSRKQSQHHQIVLQNLMSKQVNFHSDRQNKAQRQTQKQDFKGNKVKRDFQGLIMPVDLLIGGDNNFAPSKRPNTVQNLLKDRRQNKNIIAARNPTQQKDKIVVLVSSPQNQKPPARSKKTESREYWMKEPSNDYFSIRATQPSQYAQLQKPCPQPRKRLRSGGTSITASDKRTVPSSTRHQQQILHHVGVPQPEPEVITTSDMGEGNKFAPTQQDAKKDYNEKITLDSSAVRELMAVNYDSLNKNDTIFHQVTQQQSLMEAAQKKAEEEEKLQKKVHQKPQYGERNLFGLPTSEIEDLYKEEKELKKNLQRAFGIVGRRPVMHSYCDGDSASSSIAQGNPLYSFKSFKVTPNQHPKVYKKNTRQRIQDYRRNKDYGGGHSLSHDGHDGHLGQLMSHDSGSKKEPTSPHTNSAATAQEPAFGKKPFCARFQKSLERSEERRRQMNLERNERALKLHAGQQLQIQGFEKTEPEVKAIEELSSDAIQTQHSNAIVLQDQLTAGFSSQGLNTLKSPTNNMVPSQGPTPVNNHQISDCTRSPKVAAFK